MPRQEILSPGQHAQLLMLPTDARQIAECYTFSPADLDLVAHLSPLGWEHINLTGDYV
jgi:Tn3 transposase DDE domain